MSQFSVGDVVRLKSGGPKMTVVESDKQDGLLCQWFDRNGKLHKDTFAVAMLDAFIPQHKTNSA